jgi:hypothetical protein
MQVIWTCPIEATSCTNPTDFTFGFGQNCLATYQNWQQDNEILQNQLTIELVVLFISAGDFRQAPIIPTVSVASSTDRA